MREYSKEQKRKAAINVLLAFSALAVCIAVAVISITPQTYDITQGEISDRTITAPADVVDEAATQRKIEEEQAKIGPVYQINTETSQQIIKKISEDFNSFEKARAYAEGLYNADQQQKQQAVAQQIDAAMKAQQEASAAAEASLKPPVSASPVAVPTAYTVQPFEPADTDWAEFLPEGERAVLSGMLPEYLDVGDLYTVISMQGKEIEELKNAAEKLIQQSLLSGIGGEDVDALKSTLTGEVARKLHLSEDRESLVGKLIANDLYPNLVFDEKATQEERDKVAALVAPVEYKAGQNVVRQGEVVTAEQYELLKEMGMLSAETASARPYLAVIIYIVLMFMMYTVFLAVFNKKLLMNTKKIAILSILTALAYIVTAIAQLIAVHIYPIFLFVILGAVLLSPKNALVYSVFLSLLLASVTTNGQELVGGSAFVALLTMLTGSFFAIYTLKDMHYRFRMILAGLVAVVPGCVIELVTWMLKLVNTQQMIYGFAIMAASGFLCGIASIGVLPLLENAFKLTTPTKLLELSDPTHPLLKRLMMEAPGTYHHSMLVANLAEAGCNAVGGFSLLARVGAYYHDVGKLENPMLFKENQYNNINPHDHLEPEQSAEMIKRHIPDGIELLKKCNMPKEIVTIAAEHHGNSLTGYFYALACQKTPGTDPAVFRYEGTPPTTKEGAIIMLADIVEAAVRSLDAPAREEIEKTVNRLIKERYDDGQLDNAPLNRRDLNMIAVAFINIFDGVYHQRIKYPQIKIHGADDEDNVI